MTSSNRRDFPFGRTIMASSRTSSARYIPLFCSFHSLRDGGAGPRISCRRRYWPELAWCVLVLYGPQRSRSHRFSHPLDIPADLAHGILENLNQNPRLRTNSSSTSSPSASSPPSFSFFKPPLTYYLSVHHLPLSQCFSGPQRFPPNRPIAVAV